MKKKRWIILFCLCTLLISPYLGRGIVRKCMLNITLEIDFYQKDREIFQFTNRFLGFFTHKWCRVHYASCQPEGSEVRVLVTLYIDETGTGDYRRTDHSHVLSPGESMISYLPNGDRPNRYQLVFEKQDQDDAAVLFQVNGGKADPNKKPSLGFTW